MLFSRRLYSAAHAALAEKAMGHILHPMTPISATLSLTFLFVQRTFGDPGTCLIGLQRYCTIPLDLRCFLVIED